MALFEFDLDPVEKIIPWGTPDVPSLSWFALTLGHFRMPVGDQVLFRYGEEILRHLGPNLPRDADYQIASIARDILGSLAPSLAPLPPFFERIAADRPMLERLCSIELEEAAEVESMPGFTAWRWLGERSPWTSYFVANPEFYFVRIGDRIHIRWDNRNKRIDGIEAWEATYGSYEMPVDAFISECRDFSSRLLLEMHERIVQIEAGNFQPQTRVGIDSLRGEHLHWHNEFDSYFQLRPEPDIPWVEAECEIRKAAKIGGITLPD